MLCFFVIFLVTSCKHKLQKHGCEYEVLGQGSRDQFCSRPFCIGSVLCTRGHRSSGDNSRKIVAKTQMLMTRHGQAQVNGEVIYLFSIYLFFDC